MSLFIDPGEEDSPAEVFRVNGSLYRSRGNGMRNDKGGVGREGYGLGVDNNDDSCSSESSSIGVAGESSASLESSSSTVGEEEEVESKIRGDSSGSMDSLDDSLPIKRGLSNFFNGKSKSFTTLSDVVTVPLSASALAKPENPFNKRRRILMANKYRWSRTASCGSLSTIASSSSSCLPPLPPVLDCSNLFSLIEDEEELEDEGLEEDSSPPPLPSSFHGRRLKDSFRSPRSFSLSDLQQHTSQYSEP